MNDAAFQESYVAQTIAQNQVNDICSDYERQMTFHDDLGDRAMTRAETRAQNGNNSFAMSALGMANGRYETVFEQYLTNEPNCPEWGIAKLDGYYEGTVNFLGIISGIFKVCAQEDDEGNITGDVFIELEASDEFMGGPITEATNSTITGISIINGVFVVQIGDMEVALLIQEWKYVELQEATGNITIERVSDECPEGWNVH